MYASASHLATLLPLPGLLIQLASTLGRAWCSLHMLLGVTFKCKMLKSGMLCIYTWFYWAGSKENPLFSSAAQFTLVTRWVRAGQGELRLMCYLITSDITAQWNLYGGPFIRCLFPLRAQVLWGTSWIYPCATLSWIIPPDTFQPKINNNLSPNMIHSFDWMLKISCLDKGSCFYLS